MSKIMQAGFLLANKNFIKLPKSKISPPQKPVNKKTKSKASSELKETESSSETEETENN